MTLKETAQLLANYVAKNTYFLRTAAHMVVQMSQEDPGSEVFAERREEDGAPQRSEPAGAPLGPLNAAKDDLALRILLALNEAVEENGAKLVVVASNLGGPPRNFVFSDPRFRESGIPYFSLSGIFKGAKQPVRFEHDPHWTPYGHTIVADNVEQFLVDSGVFEANRSQPEQAN